MNRNNKNPNKQSLLSLGNQALRRKEYIAAINFFKAAKDSNPLLANQIDFNISFANRHMKHDGTGTLKLLPTEQLIEPPVQLTTYNYQLKIESFTDRSIVGWVVNCDIPEDIFEIYIMINGYDFIKIKNENIRADLLRHKKSAGRGGFNITLPKGVLEPGFNKMSVRLPNGKVLEAGKLELDGNRINSDMPLATRENTISIIVPIYNAVDDLKVCIERLIRFTRPGIRIILINDASPDPAINVLLSGIALTNQFTIIHNKINLGFTKTVNIGINVAGQDDVVLLNSDARVTPRWLEGMQRALATDYRIATVTAMSDRAGAFSAPTIGNINELPLGVSEIEYAMAFRRRARGLYPSVPTGNGFCMYIRRACINDIGALDEEAFPRGYGEENDFCMRARANGWQHIIDDRTYVFHDRSKSFGGEKDVLIQAGRTVVDKRYPDYKKAISVFSKSPLIALARFSAKQAIDDCLTTEGIKPRALFVVATSTGGTPQTNRDLMLALYDAWEPWLLHCDSKTISLYRVFNDKEDLLIRRHELNELVDPLNHTSFEYDRVVSNWLGQYDFDIVHIRHLAWHSLSLPQLAKNSGAFVVNSFHDYYAACPTVKFLDGDDQFCGGNCANSKSISKCGNPLWKDELPTLKSDWIFQWREKFQNALSCVDHFVTTSAHAKKSLLLALPKIDASKFSVIPHGRDFSSFTTPALLNEKPEKIKILIPGNIDEAKGGGYILDILKEDSDNILEFHILGTIHENLIEKIEVIGKDRIICHGSYKRDDFTKHVQNIAPHVGAIFSIWDETWCHTLTEIWASGLPALVLDYPTVGGRVHTAKAGWVLDKHDSALAYKKIVEQIFSEYPEKILAVKKWQSTEGLFRNTRWMAAQYHSIYKGITLPKSCNPDRATDMDYTTHNIIAVVSPSNQGQTAAPGSTHIRVWENTKNSLDQNHVFCRMTPSRLLAGVELGEIKNAIIQRNALSEENMKQLIPHLKRGAFSYAFELDDNLLKVPLDIDTDRTYQKYVKTLTSLITRASAVSVSTDELKKTISKINPKTSTIANKISAKIWRGNLNKEISEKFVAIYFGTKSHKNDFELILPALTVISKKHPEFVLLVIGALDDDYKAPEWVKVIPVPPFNKNYPAFVPWLKEITKHANLGLAPLAENSFNKYKSNLKALEYAALGLPVLASARTVYDSLALEAPAIKVVENTPTIWIEALSSIIEDKPCSFTKGLANREWVFRNHSLIENNKEYISWLHK